MLMYYSQARISSIEEDLGLQGAQFGTAVSILSVGSVMKRNYPVNLPADS